MTRTGRLRDCLTWGSRLRYQLWRLLCRLWGYSRPVLLRLDSGLLVQIRPPPASDLSTACEVFATASYDSPRPIATDSVRWVVDLGSNVGYTVLLWRQRFPGARILAVEPHPVHVEQIRLHLRANAVPPDAVTLLAAAVDERPGRLWLCSAESGSRVMAQPITAQPISTELLEVDAVDLFAAVAEHGSEPIDLLKIDIEGGEYGLLADPRFERLQVNIIVLEWHRTADHPNDGESWCRTRLGQLGFAVEPGDVRTPDFGVLWGYRL